MTDAAGAYTTTFGNEDGLPRVPLPTVEETCRRFVEWCTPLLTAGELAQTREAVEAFQRPEGPADALQAELARYGAGEDVHSWLDRSWPERYLGRRDRIAVDTNFAFLLADSDVGQLERAATLVAAVAGYKLSLDAERVPPAVQRDRPLSMAQARSLFSVTRIPGVEQDTVRAPYTTAWPGPSRHRHVVVFCRGGIFRLDAVDPSGQAYDSADLVAALRSVIEAVGGGAGLDEPAPRLGRVAASPVRAGPSQRCRARHHRDRAVLPEPRRPRARHRHRGVRAAPAWRQRGSLVRQGALVRRLPGRLGGPQRRAQRSGRHDRPGARRRGARSVAGWRRRVGGRAAA